MRAAISLNTLWIGPSLGPVERACLRSALRQGHGLTLWCYEEPAGVPEGVALGDAREILSGRSIVRHRDGSPALFANLFRYELQRQGRGTWIDADLYLVAPIDGERRYLFGLQSPDSINNAVLRMPADSPLLAPLVEVFEERKVPFWLPWRHRLAAAWRLRRTGRTGLPHMPWGSAGPNALTALARRHGVANEALPQAVFYPVPWQEAGWIVDPRVRPEDVIAESTAAIHLWNEAIRAFKHAPAPAGSFLARLQEEGR